MKISTGYPKLKIAQLFSVLFTISFSLTSTTILLAQLPAPKEVLDFSQGDRPHAFFFQNSKSSFKTIFSEKNIVETKEAISPCNQNDDDPPTITCPVNIAVNNDTGICGAVVTYTAPVGVDDCPGAVTTQIGGLGSGATFPLGVTTETYMVTDIGGNTASCSFTITVSDSENPTITCPANISTNNDTGLCNAKVTYTPPSGTDNCPGAVTTQTLGLGSGSNFPVGTTIETYTVTDASGNTANCSFNITVYDNENPSITCPANITVNSSTGICGASVTFSVPTGTDNCPGAVTNLTTGQPSGATFPVGSNTQTYTVTDGAGNTASCSFTITVNDTQNPSITCPSNITTTNDPGKCSAVVTYTSPTGTDNCPGAATNITGGLGSGATFPLGTTTETYTVIDAAGNSSNCSFTITVNDNENPNITCPANITVNNDPGICGAVVNYTPPTGSDNCPGAITTQTAGLGSGATFLVGTNTETYTTTDASGNTASCSFTITVIDAENPTIICPENIEVANEEGLCDKLVNYSVPTGYDNCPGAITVQVGGLGSGAIFPVGTTTETYKVTDASGNTAECSFTVKVIDIEKPTIICPSSISKNNDPGICGAVVKYTAPIGLDNCPGAVTTRIAGLASGSTFPVGVNTVIYKVTDASGKSATCSFTITVLDNEKPGITCPSNMVTNTDAGICGAVISYTPPIGTDNCPGAVTTQTGGLGSGSTFPVGITTETYTVTDGAGFTSSCSFTIEVIDNENPSITCPANISVNNDTGYCGALVNYTPPTGTDNCPGAVTIQSGGLGSGSTFPVGTNTETYTVTDAGGNSANCSFTITVTDAENPSITCPANIIVNNSTGICGAIVSYTAPTGTDNCPGAITIQSGGLGSGSTFSVGSNTETYTVTDASGNTSNCSFTVTVIDNENPTITCPANMTVNNDAGICGAVVSYTAPSGTDNCPGAVTIHTGGLGSGATYPVGTTTEEYTVTDASGNTGTCNFSITVNDAENPSITCPANITVLNDPGLCSAVVNYTPPTGTDNCPGAVTVQSGGLGSGSSFPVGTTTETYTVTDAGGNTASCSFTITVIDAENPVIVCPENITTVVEEGTCGQIIFYSVPTGFDNCPGAITIQTSGLGSGSVFPVGTTTETYTVIDASGNTAVCSFTVTIIDNEHPTIVCPGNIIVNNDAGICGAVVSYSPPTGTDNCPGAITIQTSGLGSGSTFPVGNTTETYEVIDVAGNQSACSFTVTVLDNENPTITCPSSISVSNDSGICGAVILYSAPTGTDNCPGAITTQTAGLGSGATFPVGTTTEEYTVTDASGNSNTCNFTITINDAENPNITCPANIVTSNDAGKCSAVVSYTPPVGTDNCPGAITTQTLGLGSGASFPIGSTTETYTVTDAGGNTASCSFNIIVNDTENPSIVCPANITTLNDSGICGKVFSYSVPTGSDNCPGAITVQSGGLGSGSTFPIGTTAESFTVTDASGNTSTCSFDITVVDGENPNIICPTNISVSNDAGICGAVVSYSAPSGTDNCPGAVTIQSGGLGSGATFPVGITTESYEVTDAAGNTSTCSFDITVSDNEPPSIICPANITVSNDSGICGAIVYYGPPVGMDNCPGAVTTQTLGLGSGATFPLGTTTETFTVTDANGNTHNCSFTITVNDTQNPIISCPANLVQPAAFGACDATITYTPPSGVDNCPGAVTVQSWGLGSGALFPVGTTTETYIVTDASGNTATCSFNITITENQNPIITCPPNIVTVNDPGICGAIVTYSTPIGYDNCPGAITTQIAGLGSGGTFPVGSTTETYQVTDNSGNVTTCSFTLTVTDNEKPFISCPALTGIFVTDPGQCYATATFSPPTAIDNCGVVYLKARIKDSDGIVVQNWTSNPNGQYAPGTYSIRWKAKDAAGNKRICNSYFSVLDNQNPIPLCTPNVTVQLNSGVGFITLSDIDAGSYDNCSFSLSLSKTHFNCSDRGTTSVSMTATDDQGNSNTCISVIEVKGTEMTIDDLTKDEGTGGGFTFFFFKVERAETGCFDQVDYASADGSATLADNDYQSVSGTAYFPPGGSTFSYVIARGIKDAKYESDENFWIELTNPSTGVTLIKDKGEAILDNDDAAMMVGNSNQGNENSSYVHTQIETNKVALFPNPVREEFQMIIPEEWLEGGSIEVDLYNNFGQKLSAFSLSENQANINVQALSSGTYQLVFKNKTGLTKSKRFVKVD